MKTQNGFTLLEKTSEIKTYLNKQSVTRKITRLQVHHMDLPNYDTWEKTDKKVFSEPHFGRTQSLNDYGKKTWNYSDGHGHYIAQHFNVFPDGKITTGRNLNSAPIGIKGWNTNAICVEIYGDFDKGKDTMTSAQKNAVIALYGELCKKFKITPSASTIRYHCWFTAGGTYLGDYISSKSAKTCPGTNFFGGNTMAKFKTNFLPLVKEYINGKSTTEETKKETTSTNKKMIKNISNESLSIRSKADWNAKSIDELKPGCSVTYKEGPLTAANGSTKMYKTISGTYITASTKYVKIIEV